MNELLFGSVIEKEALENVLAFNQIKKCDNEIDKYSEEIKEQKQEMINILKDNNIDEEYVERIHKYKNLLRNIDGDNGRISEIENLISANEEKINDLQKEAENIQNKLETLKKEIFETDDSSKIIDCQNEIENYNVKLNDLNELLEDLISNNTPLMIEREYLVAKNNDQDFSVSNYNKASIEKDLDKITKEFNKLLENLELPVRENIEFCQKKINNREIEIEKFNNRKNKVVEAFPNAIRIDIKDAFKDLENLLNELELSNTTSVFEEKNIFDDEIEEEEMVEETKVEPEITEEETDIKEEMSLLDNEVDDTTTEEVEAAPIADIEPEVDERESAADIIEETSNEEKEEVGSVSYVLSDGESLVNIAEKVYPSKDNWEAIYYFNKESIDKYLVSNGISNDFDTIKELASDTSLFTGIKLEIPTDYNYKK